MFPTMVWNRSLMGELAGQPFAAAAPPGAVHPPPGMTPHPPQTLVYCYAPVNPLDQLQSTYGLLPGVHSGTVGVAAAATSQQQLLQQQLGMQQQQQQLGMQQQLSMQHHLGMQQQQQIQQLEQQQLAAAMARSGVLQQVNIPVSMGQQGPYQVTMGQQGPYQVSMGQQGPYQVTVGPGGSQHVALVQADQLYAAPTAAVNGKKRGAEVLLGTASSTAPGMTNGSTIDQLHNELNDAKRLKLDQSPIAKSSRVLHFRGLPNDVTETEIMQLAIPFGQITNLVLAKKKNQALVEMAEVAAAQAAVSFYTQRAPLLKGRVVYVQFSNHDQLVTEVSSQAASVSDNATTDEPRTVLRVIVENLIYAVTLDIVYQMFARYGQVLKIVTFSKNSSFQALVQYADPGMAQAAKLALNGQCLYNGCNLLRVDFSKLPGLNVRFNNDKSRDYTNPMLPSSDGAPPALDQRALALASNGISTAIIPGYGTVLYTTTPSNGGPVQFGGGGTLMPMTAASLSASGLMLASPGPLATTTVLLVSNLHEEKVTPDVLFTLFGVYGDVIRVKIMFNKKDTALIQFADPTQAQIAMVNIDKLPLWGKTLKVTPSKHTVVQMPREGQPDAGLTKEYINSPLHRFKKPNSKNYHNIFPPSATLHLSNIPSSTTKETLTELFDQHGTIAGFKFFQKDCKMALVQMNSIEEAAAALIATHNHQLAETSHLRVSFSKSSVTQPNPSDLQASQLALTY